MNMTNKIRIHLIILGSGGFAQEVADIALETDDYNITAFVEGKDKTRCSEKLGGVPIIWIDELGAIGKNCQFICAVGSPRRSEFVEEAARFDMPFATIIHPRASIARSAVVEPGAIVGANAVIGAHAQIAQHVILNRGALIGHHCTIGVFATVGPGANIGGYSYIAPKVFVGMGAQILDHLRVGEEAIVGAGAVVTREVPSRTTVVGVPAKIARKLEQGR